MCFEVDKVSRERRMWASGASLESGLLIVESWGASCLHGLCSGCRRVTMLEYAA
jgi:hypothetical protein